MKHKFTKNTVIRILVIAAVIIIPLLYSYLYLGAFWDPYSRLESLPVAVVNKDVGAVINDEDRNIGREMCDELADQAKLKFIFTEEATALKGTEGDDYYAMVVIPSDFSADIASSSTTDKQTAVITFSANEKRNYLAGQILGRAVLEIEEALRDKVNSEIITKLSDTIEEVPTQMTELQDGLAQLKEGSSELSDGAGELADGTGIYADKMKDPVFAAFIQKLSDPANAKSIAVLQAASDQLKTASAQITAGAEQLSQGCDSLPKLKEALGTLAAGLRQAKAGASELAEGAESLSAGVGTVNSATAQLSGAASDIAEGAAAVNTGTARFVNGITTVEAAGAQLSDAATDIADGAESLQIGSTELSDGITTAKSGVDSAITDTNEQLGALEGLAEYAKAPVTVESKAIAPVPNYGTAFAPYFLSLSLWVGALIMFVGIYLDSEGKFKLLTAASEHKVARSFLYLLIGFAQAIALALILKYSLGLKVKNEAMYYASCCLVSMVFIAIVQFLMVHLKDLGKFLSIVLLILQLTSCGGTFPMETVPKFFNLLYPYMPMTYSVGIFKEAIGGTPGSEALRNIFVLLVILVGFMTLTIILSGMKSRKAAKAASIEIAEA